MADAPHGPNRMNPTVPESYALGPARPRSAARAARVGRLRAGLLTLALAIATLGIGYVTFRAWSTDPLTSLGEEDAAVFALVTFCLGLAFSAMAAWWLVRLAKASREGAAGAQLHTRLTSRFLIVAVVPTIVVGIFAVSTLIVGARSWFSEPVRNVADTAREVAEFYLRAPQEAIVDGLKETAREIRPLLGSLESENAQPILEAFLSRQGVRYNLIVSMILQRDGTQLAEVFDPVALEIGRLPLPPEDALEEADSGVPVILNARNRALLIGLIKLERTPDTYLYVVHRLDPLVLRLSDETIRATEQYELAEGRQIRVVLIFYLSFLAMAFVLLMGATWLGLRSAGRLVGPIGRLLTAAERVSEGDLSARVEVDRSDDELGMLGRAFNRMTGQLQTQRNELMEANRQYDRRRRFTEAVLSGVTAGVLGLDRRGIVTIANRSALALLGRRLEDVIGRPAEAIVAEMAPLVQRALVEDEPTVEGEIEIAREGRTRHLIVRVTRETGIGESHGHVVTFDDITDLVAAQRMSAWADVARRIAHEIKNPLTPIQLSAERLKRKFGKQITDDREVFAQCTETIIRQVGDLQRMVDEFSSFARMPAPAITRNDLGEIIRQAVFLQRVARPDISFEVDLPDGVVEAECDARQIGQALINILKNAGEAIEARAATGAEEGYRGQVRVVCTPVPESDAIAIDVIDNGCGLPTEDRDRLTEPYRTTRAKGTGLGLAIVRKIFEDHGGSLGLFDAPRQEGQTDGPRGAWIRGLLPVRAPAGKGAEAGAARSAREETENDAHVR
ncbi:MAG: PAS domain-containing sensor histidine kinase [Alphaproteobacteria bacterium]|nr:PAS domain-containing sensor histidine kinase [Alphaproteobacteria bacterium]